MNKVTVVKGKVKNTGWPIDGHILQFGLWNYDHESSYHLHDWEDADDEAVMQTMFYSLVEAGMEDKDCYDDFVQTWKAGKFEAPGVFCIDLDKVDKLDTLYTVHEDV